MKAHVNATLLLLTATTISSVALAAPPASQTVTQGTVAKIPGSSLAPRRADAPRTTCNVDLSVQRVRITRPTPTGSWDVGVIIKNLGTDAFNAPAIYTGLMIEETIGTYAHSWSAGDITQVPAGAEISMSYTISPAVGVVRPIRAYLNFGPDAPICGLDANASNNELILSGPLIAEWSASPRLATQVRR
jgi:hypothetical protein